MSKRQESDSGHTTSEFDHEDYEYDYEEED